MKYIVYAFNYPTLCRALRYIDSQWGKENSILIFAELVSPLPEAIKEEYHATVIRGYNRSQFGGVKGLFADIAITHASCRAVNKVIRSFNGEFTLVVFRDNEIQEATIIECVFKRYSDRCHLWIIEEGVGLYRTDRNPIHYLPIKRILFPILGLSRYALKNVSQGEHPRIEQVICSQPNLMATKFCGKNLVKQIDIFTPEFSTRFAQCILNADCINKQHFNYVFLTSPIFDFTDQTAENYDFYRSSIQKLVQTVREYGSLVIKSHPRDHYDYSPFACDDAVKICGPLENAIPFECLYEYFGRPQIISAGSSVSLNSNSEKPTIFVYRLLHYNSVMGQLMQESSDIKPIICNDFEDLKQALSHE